MASQQFQSSQGSQSSQSSQGSQKRKLETMIKAEHVKITSANEDITVKLEKCLNEWLQIFEGTGCFRGKFFPARVHLRLNRFETTNLLDFCVCLYFVNINNSQWLRNSLKVMRRRRLRGQGRSQRTLLF
jgi:hypothetical protein